MQDLFTIDLAHVHVLRELRDRGTVTATASALHLSPSAVSQQLRALSRSLGVPLTERDGRRLRLTPQATLVLRHAESIESELERVRANLAAFNEGHAGTVTIAAFASAIEPIAIPALQSLRRDRPELAVSIRELEAPAGFSALERGEVDVLITVDYVDGPTHDDARYHRVDLVRDPLLAVLPPRHPLAHRSEPIDIRALARDRWVMGNPGHPCIDATIAAQSSAGFTPTVAHRTDDWTAAAAIVASEDAVALIPQLALRNIRPAPLAIRPVTEPLARHIYAATRNGSQASPHIAAATAALAAAANDCLSVSVE